MYQIYVYQKYFVKVIDAISLWLPGFKSSLAYVLGQVRNWLPIGFNSHGLVNEFLLVVY